MIGKLEYEDFDGLVTEIEFQHENNTDQTILEFCGTGDPLFIKWAGERYSTTAPSSATLNLFIQTLEQRQFLEDVFNGGWVISVYKDKNPFWYGQITPTLGIETYRAYPYQLSLNCNDGIAQSKRKHFLMIDWPEPYPTGRVSVLDFLIKMIDTFYYPSGTFTINECTRLKPQALDATGLTDVYIDSRVFMYDDKDEYLNNEDVIDNLLGLYNLQLFQWKQQWWVVDLEAQWDNGTITYTPYTVQDGIWTLQTQVIETLGIFDLYSCDKENIEIGGSGRLDFQPAWLNATIGQQFQLNNQILPAFANRLGNSYHGHSQTVEDGIPYDFVELEFAGNYLPVSGMLNHWEDNGLVVLQWPDSTQDNTGYLWTKTILPEYVNNNVRISAKIDSNLQFNQFRFNINMMATVGGKVQSGNLRGQAVMKLRYVNEANTLDWTYWYNDDDAFLGWTPDDKRLIYPHAELSVQANMPDDALMTGGTFYFTLYNSQDVYPSTAGQGMLFYNFQLGIVGSSFETLEIEQVDKSIRRNRMIEAAAWTNIATLGTTGLAQFAAFSFAEFINQMTQIQKDKKKDYVGGILNGHYIASDFDWDNVVQIDINPNSEDTNDFKYMLGINLIGIKSYHELHLSSFYNVWEEAIDSWSKDGLPSTNDLTRWKSQQFIRDNTSYTTQLSGRYKAPIITPLQLIYDYEGRVYRFLNGTWNDRRGTWNCSFMEAKFVQIPGQPSVGDFNPLATNNDFYTEGNYYGENEIPYPAPFDFTSWTKYFTTVLADATTSPNTTQLASQIVEDTSTSTHNINLDITLDVGVPYQYLVFIKPAGRTWVRINNSTSLDPATNAYFDLVNFTVGTYEYQEKPTIEDYGNGWALIKINILAVSASDARVRILPALGDLDSNYTGDGVSGIYVWNVQFRKKID